MPRRDKGEGCVSQRKDGTWTARIDLGLTPDGKRKIKALYGKTEKEVKKKLRELKKELAKNEYSQQKKKTVSELMSEWLLTTKKNELKPASFDRLEATINNQINPRIGFYQIGNITAADIQDAINDMVKCGYSYSTIKKAYNAIHACFLLAYDRGEIPKSPVVRISLPKQIEKTKSEIVFYSDDETTILTDYATQKYKTGKYVYKHGYAIPLLLNTGMRVGELLALKWDNVDFESKQIHIVETRGQVINRVDDAEQKYIMVDRKTKTQSGNRIILMNKQSEEALMYFKSLNYGNKYVMANSNTGVITYRNLHRVFSMILEKSEIRRGSLHSLRHTFATRLFKNGIDIKVISEILGHSDVSITYNIYTHVIQEQKTHAVNLLDDI